MSITERQHEYIKILSDYDSTREADAKDITDFLKNHSEGDISELSKKEASDLIQLLLERPVQYTLVCDRVVILDKQEVNSFHFLGEIEACLHNCPDPVIQGSVGSCSHFLKYQQAEYEEEPEE